MTTRSKDIILIQGMIVGVVGVIVVILAVIIVPSLIGTRRETGESSLKYHLHQMRTAIRYFQIDTGDFPAKLDDLVTDKPPDVGGNGTKIKSKDFKGPYLTTDGNLPKNPITGGNVEGIDWVYTKKTGDVHAPPGKAMDGTDYSKW